MGLYSVVDAHLLIKSEWTWWQKLTADAMGKFPLISWPTCWSFETPINKDPPLKKAAAQWAWILFERCTCICFFFHLLCLFVCLEVFIDKCMGTWWQKLTADATGNLLSSQTDKLMAATKFSDYLGLNHYKKAKKI